MPSTPSGTPPARPDTRSRRGEGHSAPRAISRARRAPARRALRVPAVRAPAGTTRTCRSSARACGGAIPAFSPVHPGHNAGDSPRRGTDTPTRPAAAAHDSCVMSPERPESAPDARSAGVVHTGPAVRVGPTDAGPSLPMGVHPDTTQDNTGPTGPPAAEIRHFPSAHAAQLLRCVTETAANRRPAPDLQELCAPDTTQEKAGPLAVPGRLPGHKRRTTQAFPALPPQSGRPGRRPPHDSCVLSPKRPQTDCAHQTCRSCVHRAPDTTQESYAPASESGAGGGRRQARRNAAFSDSGASACSTASMLAPMTAAFSAAADCTIERYSVASGVERV